MNVLSYGLVLVSTLDLGFLGVNGVPFVQSVICMGNLTGYQNIYGTKGHKKTEEPKRRGHN